MGGKAQGLALALLLVGTGCNRPGTTPLEQAPLEELQAPHEAELKLSVAEWPLDLRECVKVAKEFERHRMEIHVIWQTREAPSTERLGAFAGKMFRQYWDPRGLSAGTGGKLMAQGKLIESNALAWRIALARASLRPRN